LGRLFLSRPLILLSPIDNPSHADAANWTTTQRDDLPPTDALTYDQWAANQGVVGGSAGDDDGDTLTNFFEYLYGSLATDTSDAPLPTIEIRTLDVDGTSDEYVTVSFQQNQNAQGAILSVEITDDLSTWTNNADDTVEWQRTANDDGTDTVTLRFAEPIRTEDKQRYVRLRGLAR
jgi:hypothetical protein